MPSAVISKGELYIFHSPLSILYLVKSTSEVVSLAKRVTVTFEVYQPLLPEVPAREISVAGAVLSTVIPSEMPTADHNPALFFAFTLK